MKAFKYNIHLLIKRSLLVIVLFTISRLFFYFLNQSYFADITGWSLVRHFLYGIRYDASSFFWFNLPFIVLSLVPIYLLSLKWYQKILKWLFCVVNSVVLSVNFIDSKLFEFSEKRMTTDIFNAQWLGDDFITMLPHFLKDYWFVALMYIIIVVLIVKLYPKYNSRVIILDTTKALHVGKRWFIRLIILLLFGVLGRGGFQLKPLNIISAAQYSSPKNMPLVLNSSFTVMKTLGDKPLEGKKWFEVNELDSIFNPLYYFNANNFVPKNVVLIILESFGKEYSGLLNGKMGYTPNLDSIMDLGLFHSNCFANGKRSIEALPSIISSLPPLMDKPFITSTYNSNSINSIGSLLKEKGYDTKFYHGGKNGTMGFDNFVKLAGIEHYYGLDEYPNKEDYDGGWGIYDEPYLQYITDELDKTKEPFFAGVFTLSSHHPYEIPQKYVGKFPKGTLVNHESIGYADYALGEFFKTASTKPWFNNTLFVLTADHTAQTEGGFYASKLGRYAVPLVFYAPGDTLLIGKSKSICSQVDILPSIMDYLKYDEPFVAFGSSVFNDSIPKYSNTFTNGIYQFVYDTVAISSNGNSLISAYYISKGKINKVRVKDSVPEAVSDAFEFQRAILQQYNNRMIENNLVVPN